MKASSEYLDFIIDKLSPIGGIRSRAMFGGYGIFYEDSMFAIIAEDILYFKVDESNRAMYKKAQSKPFPHGISYWEVPAEVIEEDSKLLDWADLSIGIARSVPKKRSKETPLIVVDMQDLRLKYLTEEYTARVNRVIDYIEANISEDLSLKELADVAHFSPFHFHRIFRGMVGETLNDFIQRIRVEKAAAKLVLNPKKSVTEIAFECGFSGSSAFARSFRETYGMSASDWRSGGHIQYSKKSKDRQSVGNIEKDSDVSIYYNQATINQLWRVKMKNSEIQTNVEVKDMPELHVAYVRHIGPYKGDQELFGRLFNKLMTWAGPRGLLRFPETKVMTIYHDNPDITDESRLRTDACITVPEDTQVEGEIGKAQIPAGKYAVAHFEITPDQYQDAWNAVYGGWLPESGYQPEDGSCYELYLNDPKQHPEGKHVVDICVPVKPL